MEYKFEGVWPLGEEGSHLLELTLVKVSCFGCLHIRFCSYLNPAISVAVA